MTTVQISHSKLKLKTSFSLSPLSPSQTNLQLGRLVRFQTYSYIYICYKNRAKSSRDMAEVTAENGTKVTDCAGDGEGAVTEAALLEDGVELMMVEEEEGKEGGEGRSRRGRVKGPWSPEEDLLLSGLVNKFGARNWGLIAKGIPGRSGKSCRLRWCNQLDPCVKHKPFTGNFCRLLKNILFTPSPSFAIV